MQYYNCITVFVNALNIFDILPQILMYKINLLFKFLCVYDDSL